MSSNRIYEEIEPVEYVNLSNVPPTKGEPILSSTSADVQVEYETIFSSTDVPVEEIEPVEYETIVGSSNVPTKCEPILSSTDVQVEYETVFSTTDVPVEYETIVSSTDVPITSHV